MYKYFCKFIYIYFFYFLILSNNLNISYSNKEITNILQEDIKLRPVYTGLVFNNWLPFVDLESFDNFNLLSSKDIVIFEFQNTRDNKVYKSPEYMLWNYKDVYKDYVSSLNSNLIYNSEW